MKKRVRKKISYSLKGKSIRDFPEILKSFHPDLNLKIDILNINLQSKKKYWFLCKNGHSYFTSMFSRSMSHVLRGNEGCIYCPGGKQAWPGESFKDLYPSLVAEIDPKWLERNNIKNLKPGSNKKVTWKCKNNHKFTQRIFSRVNGAKCPKCYGRRYSKSEIRIYCEIKKYYPKTIIHKKINNLECDIFVPNLNAIIEYDGFHWHKNKIETDQKKTKQLEELGYNVLRIRNKLDQISKNNIYSKKDIIDKNDVNQVFLFLSKLETNKGIRKDLLKYHNFEDWQQKTEFNEMILKVSMVLYEDSLEKKLPEVKKFWDYEKNYPLTPSDVSYGSKEKCWLKCEKKHSFETVVGRIKSKFGNKSSFCTICSGHKVIHETSFGSRFPQLLNEWDFEKNDEINPFTLPTTIIKDFWWVCSKCNNSFKQRLANRTIQKSGCPKCAEKKRKKTMLEVALNRRKKYMSLRQLKLLLKEKQINTIKRYIEFKRLNKNLIPSDPRNYYGRRGHEIKWNDVFEK